MTENTDGIPALASLYCQVLIEKRCSYPFLMKDFLSLSIPIFYGSKDSFAKIIEEMNIPNGHVAYEDNIIFINKQITPPTFLSMEKSKYLFHEDKGWSNFIIIAEETGDGYILTLVDSRNESYESIKLAINNL